MSSGTPSTRRFSKVFFGPWKEDRLLFTIYFLLLEPALELLQRILATHVQKETFESLSNSLPKDMNSQMRDDSSIRSKRIYELTFNEIYTVYEHILKLDNTKIPKKYSIDNILQMGKNVLITKIRSYTPDEMNAIVEQLIKDISEIDEKSKEHVYNVVKLLNDPSINYSNINRLFIENYKYLNLSRKLVNTIKEEYIVHKSNLKINSFFECLKKIYKAFSFAQECFEFLIRVDDPTQMQENFVDSDKGKQYIKNIQVVFQRIEGTILEDCKIYLRRIKFNSGSVLIHGIFSLQTGDQESKIDIMREENIANIEKELTSIFKMKTTIQLNRTFLHSFLDINIMAVSKNINKIEPLFKEQLQSKPLYMKSEVVIGKKRSIKPWPKSKNKFKDVEEPKTKKIKPEDNKSEPFARPPISQLKKTGVSFLQDASCFEVAPKLNKCRECRWSHTQRQKQQTIANIFCRFYAFRRLRYTKNGQIAPAGFCDPKVDAQIEDLKLWLPSQELSPTNMDKDTAKIILQNLSKQFTTIYKQEQEAAHIHLSEDRTVAWKRVVLGVREMCDVCEASIFNKHWACGNCGFVVCIDCYRTRANGPPSHRDEDAKDKDDYDWLLCTNRQSHQQDAMIRGGGSQKKGGYPLLNLLTPPPHKNQFLFRFAPLRIAFLHFGTLNF